jgi:ESCRT-II complex subunit VPS22
MRRGPGIAALDRSAFSSAQYANLGDSLTSSQLAELRSQLDTFATALRNFSANHRNDIKRDPNFRHAFQKMCSSIGVDPLGGTPSPASGARGAGAKMAGLWNHMLGLGDWQYELGIQIVDICVSTRHLNGGLIELQDLIKRIIRLRTGKDAEASSSTAREALISEDDILRSIKTLEPLGSGYEAISIGAKRFVRSVPKELDTDSTVVLAMLADSSSVALRDGQGIPYVTLPSLLPAAPRLQAAGLGAAGKSVWTEERAMAALQDIATGAGMLWVDEGVYPVRYYSLGVAEGIWASAAGLAEDATIERLLAQATMI